MDKDLVEVLIPIPLMEKFSYFPPKNRSNQLKKGSRVLVPFGNRLMVGVVWGFNKKSNSDKRKYSNLIITRSFSKAFSLAGSRIGFSITNSSNSTHLKKIITF